MGLGEALEQNREAALAKEQMRQEAIQRRRDRIEESITGAVKALMTIQGGAVVAIGALLQALLGKQDAAALAAFKIFGLVALSLYAVGLCAAAAVFWLRYLYHLERLVRATEAKRWEYGAWRASAASAACFLIGTCVVVWGLALAL